MEPRLPMSRLREFAVALAHRPDPDDWTGPAFFVGIVDSDEHGLTVAVRPIEPADAHPSELLPFLDVPDDWLALGLAAFGWARSLDRPDEGRRRAHSVDLFDRRGAGVAVIHRHGDDAPLIIEHQPGEGNEPIGLMADGLRHALGVPTPRCPVTVTEYLATIWLAAVEDAARSNPRLTWARIAALHPAVTGSGPGASGRLVDAGRALAEGVDWPGLRLATAQGADLGIDIAAELAAWMDDDMFARALVARVPPLDELRRRLDEGLPPSRARRIEDVLAAWGLTRRGRPRAGGCGQAAS